MTESPYFNSVSSTLWPPTSRPRPHESNPAASQDSQEHFLGHGLAGVADNVEGRQGPAAHGVDVAQGIGRGDLAEVYGSLTTGVKKSTV